MKYAIITCINGAYKIRMESLASIESAKVQYHGVCQGLWNAKEVTTATVMIADENLNCVEGYREFVHHEQVAESEN